MASKGDTQINNFVGGLITEASPLSFPPGASLDEVNMKLLRDGSRERRLGLDYEDGYLLSDAGFTLEELKSAKQRFFRWISPSGSNKVEIGVIQIGNSLSFIDLFQENPSAHILNNGNSITAPTSSSVVFDFAIIANKLLVVSEELYRPYLLSYNEDTEEITAETDFINIRDLYGVDDSLRDDERPGILSKNHEYNLRNQGWSGNIIATSEADALQVTFNDIGVYPSNSDTWSLGKIEDVNSADIDKYDPQTLKKNSFDLGRAARGHFIIDLYNRGASRTEVIGVDVTAVDREVGRVSTVASYAGRAFYSGIRSRVEGGDKFSVNLSSAILFSQVAESESDLVKCYQKADPTSPEASDIVDTDGGVIIVSGAVDIVKLIPIKASLFVFARNGVWEIRGDDGGFKATAFQVTKVSSIGVFSRDSIVDANGTIFFWGGDGIFALAPEQVSGSFEATNVSITTIQRLYNTIPNLSKQNSRGYYDESENTVRWLYSSDESKIVGEPIDIPDPEPEVFGIGDPVEGAPSRVEPRVVRVNNTTALIIYADSFNRILYYQVVTIDPDTLATTLGTENEVVNTGVNGGLRGYTVEKLSDNRVVIISSETSTETKARLVTFSDNSPTVGSPVVVNSVFSPISTTSKLTSDIIDSSRIIIHSKNITNGTGSFQVVKVSDSTITFGSVVNTTSVNHIEPQVAMITTTDGFYLDTLSGTPVQLTGWFSITDVTITLKNESSAPDLADYPSGTSSRQSTSVDLIRLSTTQVLSVGTGLITDTVSTNENGILIFKLQKNGNDVEEAELLFDKDPELNPTTSYPTGIYNNNYVWIIYIDNAFPSKMILGQYLVGSSSISHTSSMTLETQTLFETKPEITLLGNNIALLAYRTISSTDAIKAMAIRLA